MHVSVRCLLLFLPPVFVTVCYNIENVPYESTQEQNYFSSTADNPELPIPSLAILLSSPVSPRSIHASPSIAVCRSQPNCPPDRQSGGTPISFGLVQHPTVSWLDSVSDWTDPTC